jgi:hypothetical protein
VDLITYDELRPALREEGLREQEAQLTADGALL